MVSTAWWWTTELILLTKSDEPGQTVRLFIMDVYGANVDVTTSFSKLSTFCWKVFFHKILSKGGFDEGGGGMRQRLMVQEEEGSTSSLIDKTSKSCQGSQSKKYVSNTQWPKMTNVKIY